MSSTISTDCCLACGSASLFEVLNLGKQSPVNTLTINSVEIEGFPLVLLACESCGHAQQSCLVPPNLLFSNYTYASSTSNSLNQYSEDFATLISAVFPTNVDVLEIASNDGILLQYLAKNHANVVGIDPADEMVKRAVQRGLNAKSGFWPEDAAKLGIENFDLILGQNVFAHTPDPFGFLSSVFKHLKPGGVSIFQTSQADMVLRNEFDTIYHEHFSFFCENSARVIGERVGFTNLVTFYSPIHGGSSIYCFSKDESGKKRSYSLQREFEVKYPALNSANDFPQSRRVRSVEDWKNFGIASNQILEDMKSEVSQRKKENFRVISVGASAKGITAMKAAGLEIDFILDEAQDKIEKWIPGLGMQIHSLKDFATSERDFYIFTAWNFKEELARKLIACGAKPNSQVMFFFPDVHTVLLKDILPEL